MKTQEAMYVFSLKKAKMFPKRKRIKKALGIIKKEVFKHARAKKPVISTEVNEFLHKHSKNIPEKIKVVLFKSKDNAFVFLQSGTQLQKTKEKELQEQKTKNEKEEKKETKPEEKSLEETKQEQENKKKLEEKKQKEKASMAGDKKRKTGRT